MSFRSAALLLVFWFVEQNKLAQQQARYAATHQAVPVTVTNLVTLTNQQIAAVNPLNPAPAVFDTNTPEQLLVLTNARARYTFTSRGGGLQSVELLDYPETISPRWKKTKTAEGVATLNTRAPVPVLAILGDASLVGDGNFTLTATADGVRADKSLTNGLRLTKEFHLSSNYLVTASVRMENTSAQPITLPAQEWVVGTATPMGPDDNGSERRHVVVRREKRRGPSRGLVFRRRIRLLPERAAFGIHRRIERRGLGLGAQPVFCAGGDAEGAGDTNHRPPGGSAAVPRRRAHPGHPAAPGHSDGDHLSDGNPRGA